MAPLETLVELVDRLASFGPRTALVAFQTGGRLEWSYAELARTVRELAEGLVAAGVAPGDRVALLAGDRPEWLVSALAVVRAGGVATLLDAQLPDDRVSHALADSASRLVFTDGVRASRVARVAPGVRIVRLDIPVEDPAGWQALRAGAGRQPLPSRQATDPAALFYTSGTTGPPKGVPLTHGNLAFQVATLQAIGLVTPRDRICLPLPLHHVYPFVVGALTPLALGLPIVLPSALTGPQILHALGEGEATVLIGVPRLYGALVSAIETQLAARGRVVATVVRLALGASRWVRRRLGLHWGRWLFGAVRARLGPRLRLLTSGGAALDPAVARTLDGLGWQLASGYGLTETSPLLTMTLPGGTAPDSAGAPIPGVTLRIAPVTGGPPGDGEIQARGPGVFAGYLNLPEKTRDAFTGDGWFRTGDLGHLDPAGMLHITGRVDEMLVTEGGENVQPENVEDVFQRHPFLRDFALLQQQGHLAGLALPDLGRIEAAGLTDVGRAVRDAVAAVNRELPSYQRVVDLAVTRDPLPRTRLGKLQRRALPALYARTAMGSDTDAGEPIAIADMAEADRALLDSEAAAAVWAWLGRRYPRRHLTMDVSLGLDLGIDSLAWLGLGLEIQREVGIELDGTAIARVATVRDLLREIAAAPRAGTAPAADWWDDPARRLSPAEARWVAPLGPAQRLAARILTRVNACLSRRLFQLRTVGLEHLPAEPWVLVSNHVSILDPPLLCAALGWQRLARTYWGGWTGIAFANPLMRTMSRLWRVLPIEQRRSAGSTLALAATVLGRGDCLIWFPEGGRSRTGAVLPFHAGIGLLLGHFPRPVVPVHVRGTFDALPAGKRWPKLTPVTVTFGPAMDPRLLATPGVEPEEAARQVAEALRLAVVELGHTVS